MKKALFLLVAAVFFLATSVNTTSAKDFDGLLEMRIKSNGKDFKCNATELKKGVALTAAHCLLDGMKTKIKLRRAGTDEEIEAKPFASDPVRDVAILNYEGALFNTKNTLKAELPNVGERADVLFPSMGFSEFRYATKSGSVIQVYDNAIVLSSIGDQGLSGSPVVHKGEIIGIIIIGAAPDNNLGLNPGQLLALPSSMILKTFPELAS